MKEKESALPKIQQHFIRTWSCPFYFHFVFLFLQDLFTCLPLRPDPPNSLSLKPNHYRLPHLTKILSWAWEGTSETNQRHNFRETWTRARLPHISSKMAFSVSHSGLDARMKRMLSSTKNKCDITGLCLQIWIPCSSPFELAFLIIDEISFTSHQLKL